MGVKATSTDSKLDWHQQRFGETVNRKCSEEKVRQRESERERERKREMRECEIENVNGMRKRCNKNEMARV